MIKKMRSQQRERKWPGAVRSRREGLKWSKGREAVRERREQTWQRQLEMGQMGVGREERQPEMLKMVREHQ